MARTDPGRHLALAHFGMGRGGVERVIGLDASGMAQDAGQVYLRTRRLVLRKLRHADADAVFELDSDPQVIRYTSPAGPGTIEQVRQETLPRLMGYYMKDDRFGFWAAEDRACGDFLGWFHLRPTNWLKTELELGYRLRRAVWGRGLATEGSRALVDKAFAQLDAKRVIASAVAENAASIRVMEKVGMEKEKSFVYPGTGWLAVVYGIARDDWERKRIL